MGSGSSFASFEKMDAVPEGVNLTHYRIIT